MSDLDDFTAQLNSGTEETKAGGEATTEQQQLAEMMAKMTPEQRQAFEQAQAAQAKIDARPLVHEALKGKVDCKWFGHAGFKI